jgi:hypothetical protein
MKANFKIENDDSDKNKDDESIKKIEDKDELPKGWNLWSIRSKGNK